MPAHQRILLKLSGEMMAPEGGHGLATNSIRSVAEEIASVVRGGVQVGVVVGAGNLVRGAGPNRSRLDIAQQRLDTMGMLATAINCTGLRDQLEKAGVPAVHMSAFPAIPLTEPLDSEKAREHLCAGRVVLFSGGTGMPFFSTDTAAVCRALQIEAQALYKGTQVDGVYDGDPRAPGGSEAVLLPRVAYALALEKQLKFMDLAAIALAAQQRLVMVIYNAHTPDGLAKALNGELTCSQVGPD
jgi:uridylate kinase